MLLLSGGCSLVYGLELQDCNKTHSHSVWPALWANDNNIDYATAAFVGASNQGIARQFIYYCENIQKPDLAIIQWTYPIRYELRINHSESGTYYCPITAWTNIAVTVDPVIAVSNKSKAQWQHLPVEERLRLEKSAYEHLVAIANSTKGKVARQWYDLVHCRETELYYSLTAVDYLMNYLENKKIKYVFSAADDAILADENLLSDIYVKSLVTRVKQVPWVFFGSKQQGFTQWAQAEKFKIGIESHPLEEAHMAAYNNTKTVVNHLLL